MDVDRPDPMVMGRIFGSQASMEPRPDGRG